MEAINDESSKVPKVTVKVGRKRGPKAGNKKERKKLKIKLTAKEGGSSGNVVVSEDEEEPEPTLEEHLILRVPEGEMADKLHDYVKRREIPEDVKLHFKDSRRGNFFMDGQRHDVTLVDLPTIIESQKTLDKKQFYKIADISQMLVVDGASMEPASQHVSGRHPDPYQYPHGLTAPLKWVRKRRFRKKLSKRAIEEVEREVERLLEEDAAAENVIYEIVDMHDEENESDIGTQDVGSDEESESDAELEAAIDRDLEELDEEADDEDDDEDDSDEDEDSDDDDVDDEAVGEIEQKQQEILEIKQAIERKTRDLLTAPNTILKKRFETMIESLKKELALKESHLQELQKQELNNK
ncbi:TAFII55 protein conserved region-domain-containing protein [Gongronella butleri]|nr:TAFII55 protein conserved region-domain-containing protein [Gongronella butleri]